MQTNFLSSLFFVLLIIFSIFLFFLIKKTKHQTYKKFLWTENTKDQAYKKFFRGKKETKIGGIVSKIFFFGTPRTHLKKFFLNSLILIYNYKIGNICMGDSLLMLAFIEFNDSLLVSLLHLNGQIGLVGFSLNQLKMHSL